MSEHKTVNFRDAIIEAFEDSKKYQGLLDENKRLQERIKTLRALTQGDTYALQKKIKLLEEELGATIDVRDSYWNRLGKTQIELDELKACTWPAHRPTCLTCEHWESPEARVARNPGPKYGHDPKRGQCHKDPAGLMPPAHDWCSKHAPC